nr:hypothetical protein B7L52_00915 [Pectobacterium carotovorum]
MLFRFLMELHFYQPNDLSFDLARVKDFVIYKKDKFDHDAQVQIAYALYEMPFTLCREKYQNSDVQSFIDAARAETVMKETMDTWNEKIKTQTNKVEKLKERLDEQENAFNFVGLYRGFDDLSDKKKIESRRSFWFTLLLGVLVLLPFGIDVSLVYNGVIKLDSMLSLLSLVPAFTLTFIFIYYFRISLSNYTSIKAQVNQIELRKTLCTFIQKYSEYAKEMKANDGNSLEKFESIIFSNIMPSEDKIPSTFDGIEQIAKLIESVKGK